MKKWLYVFVMLAAMVITWTNPALNAVVKLIVSAACIGTSFILVTEDKIKKDGEE
jgi:uncharacterized membrane-anchored protein